MPKRSKPTKFPLRKGQRLVDTAWEEPGKIIRVLKTRVWVVFENFKRIPDHYLRWPVYYTYHYFWLKDEMRYGTPIYISYKRPYFLKCVREGRFTTMKKALELALCS
jgi:hypothetical protein